MRSNFVACLITGLGVILGGCSSADSENADCAGPPLEFEGKQYDPSTAVDGTPFGKQVGKAVIEGCSEGGVEPPSADEEVVLYRIRGIDPADALGTRPGGGLKMIWVAFGADGVALGHSELPPEIRQYAEP